MAAGNLPTPEELRQLLRYDPERGELLWRERPRSVFSSNRAHRAWNARYAGAPAFTAKSDKGYRRGCLGGRQYIAHRVIWAIVHGVWPESEIDHINGDKADNRIANLRAVTRMENVRNMPRYRNNQSGVTDVYFHNVMKRWCAAIRIGGRVTNLGYYDTLAAAAEARRAAEGVFGFHPNHGRDQHEAA